MRSISVTYCKSVTNHACQEGRNGDGHHTRGHRAGTTRTHSTIDNSTCAIVVRSVVNIQDSCQCRLCSHPASSRPGPADRYAPSGLPFPPLRGGPLREAEDGYTCPPDPDGSPTGKHVTPGLQSPAAGTGRRDTCVGRWRGQPHNKDTLKHTSTTGTAHRDTRMDI